MSIVTTFTTDPRTQLVEYTELLFCLADMGKTSYQERISKVNSVIEAYVEHTGLRPESRTADHLSGLVLFDDLRDRNSHKSKHNEYPILSDLQLFRRRFGSRGKEGNMQGETSLESADCVATDGIDYRYPNRRTRTIDELVYVDENAIIKNAERRKRYIKFISPGQIVTYNLYETGGELTEEFTSRVGIGRRWATEMGRVNETKVVREGTEITASLAA